MKIGFIGAGKVGFSLGKFLARGHVQLTGYYSRRPESAREAASFTGARAYESTEELIRDSDAIFLTVPDGAISSVYQSLEKSLISEKILCHCSGSLSVSEAFPAIAQYGAYGYSIHPLFPVSSKLTSYRELSGAFFCIEGSGPHLGQWQELLQSLGAAVQIISGEDKIRYHAACAISSNLICGLVQESLELLETCGFSRSMALQAITPLLRSNLEHIVQSGPVAALTGPVERCDTKTVEKHLSCFSSEEERELYRWVSRKLVQLAAQKNPGRDYRALEDLLH